MVAVRRRGGGLEAPVHGIDRLLGNIETGRFERSLSALTAVGALVTAAEIFFEHDGASFGNGLQGTYLHMRGIGQKPGGWSNARYNIEMGPPLLAPLLVTMVGGMGLLAAVLRREK